MPPLRVSRFQKKASPKAAVKHNPSQGSREQRQTSSRDAQAGVKPPSPRERRPPQSGPSEPPAGPAPPLGGARAPIPPERPPRRPAHRADSWERWATGRAGPARPPPGRSAPHKPSGSPSPLAAMLPPPSRQPSPPAG